MANQDDTNFIIAKRIRENADKWYWPLLSRNISITMDVIDNTSDLPWDPVYITQNLNLHFDFILGHVEDYNNHWYYISKHQCITMDFVKLYPHLPWNYLGLSRNPSITIDDVLENIEMPWNWEKLSCNPNMTWDIIQAHTELPWCIDEFSFNPNITWDIIKKHPNVNWNYGMFIVFNDNVTHDVVKNNPDILVYVPREYMNNKYYIQSCPWYLDVTDATWDMMKHYNNCILYIGFCIGKNPNLTWDFVKNNTNKPWDYQQLSSNPTITWEIVKNNLDKPWDYSQLSLNQKITWDIVQENPQVEWNWGLLCANPSIFKLTDQDVKFVSSVRYIQKMWREALYNPKYAICRKRILKEFIELGDI